MPDHDGKFDSEEEVIETTALPAHREDAEVDKPADANQWEEEKNRNTRGVDYAKDLQEMRMYWREMMIDFGKGDKPKSEKVLGMIRAMLALEANGTSAKDRIAAMKELSATYGFSKTVVEHSTPDAYHRELDRLTGRLPNDDG